MEVEYDLEFPLSKQWFNDLLEYNINGEECTTKEFINFFTERRSSGGVYFIYNETADIFRIGKTQSFRERINSHMRTTGCIIKVICTIESEPGEFDYHKLETFILSKLKAFRHNRGDWFKLTPELVIEVTDFFGRVENYYASELIIRNVIPQKYRNPFIYTETD